MKQCMSNAQPLWQHLERTFREKIETEIFLGFFSTYHHNSQHECSAILNERKCRFEKREVQLTKFSRPEESFSANPNECKYSFLSTGLHTHSIPFHSVPAKEKKTDFNLQGRVITFFGFTSLMLLFDTNFESAMVSIKILQDTSCTVSEKVANVTYTSTTTHDEAKWLAWQA